MDHLLRLRDCYYLQVWDTIWDAGEENFGVAQNLLQDVSGRNQRWEKGEIWVIWMRSSSGKMKG